MMKEKKLLELKSKNFVFWYWSDGIIDIHDNEDPHIALVLEKEDADVLVKLIQQYNSIKGMSIILDMSFEDLIDKIQSLR